MSYSHQQPWRQDQDSGNSWVPSYQRKPLPTQPPPPRPYSAEDEKVAGNSGRGDSYNRSGGEAARCKKCMGPIGDDEEWIAVGDKGQRDVRQMAHPKFNSRTPWTFYHQSCVKDLGHGKNHPDCTRPHGPCTDWHLRGKCKRSIDCGHCHFDHPELKEKYPELPKDGVLRRPQRRERLAMLKKAYEDELRSFLSPEGEEPLPDFIASFAMEFPEAEAVLRQELPASDKTEIIEKWKHLSEAHDIKCLWKRLVEELQKSLNTNSASVDPSSLVTRFFNCADSFQEVVEVWLPEQGVRLDEDVLAYLNTSSDLTELVERMEEITSL